MKLRLRVNDVIVKVVKGFQRLLLTGKNHIFDLFRCLKTKLGYPIFMFLLRLIIV